MTTAAATAIRKVITGLPSAMDRDDQRKAYEHAEDFFAAMTRVCEADDELAETDESLVDRPYWQKEREQALGKACDAASKMPAVWLAILGVKIERAPVAVMAPAAE